MSKKIEIYTWDTCPFCQRALALLNSKGVNFEQHKIDGDNETRTKISEKSGKTSVPQIFVDDVFIGGCDEVHALNDAGTLDAILGL